MGLALDIFFSALGSAYLIYGKREYEPRFLVAGLSCWCIRTWWTTR